MSETLREDQKLLNQLKIGNEKAWSMLYQKGNYPVIKNYIVRNNGKVDDAKDIYQDAIIILYKKVLQNDFLLSSSISTYIYGIAKNLWLKRLNKQQVVSNFDLANIETIPNEEENKENFEINLENVQKAVDKIGDPCKTLLQLFYFQKKTMEEIASRLKYNNPNTAKQQKYKCIIRLRKMLNV